MIALLTLMLVLTELPPQPLAPDQCAMALWSKSSQKRIVFWTAAEAMRLATSPEITSLAPEPGSGSGAPILGLLPQASFISEGLTARLTARLDVEIIPSQNGESATVPSGTLTLTTADGTAQIIPVVGLIGCG
jgi:hypothetical protein